jgi:glycosyltransferase involved in cell wall biosynthesis
MKLAVATSFPRDPAAPRGGVEAVSVNLVKALAALGRLDVHVVTTDAACAQPSTTAWENATIHRLPRSNRSTLGEALGPGRQAVQACLRDLQPEVVHAHDTYGLMVQGLPFPRVFTIHGFIHADTRFARGRFSWLRSQLWRWYELRGWADQPHIISISPYVRERLAGIYPGVIHDIDNPIAEHFFQIERQARPGTIFSAALVCPRKNPLMLIEALALLKARGLHAELRLAGSVSDAAYGRRMEARISELGLQDRVVLLGSISSVQVRQELAAASIFALVSLEEGSPMGLEEAMAVGVPVVTSNRCGMPYMVQDGRTGFLVNPTDPEDIADRLGEILANDQLQAEMGRRARLVAAERFHPTAVAERTLEVYHRAARDHHRPTHVR